VQNRLTHPAKRLRGREALIKPGRDAEMDIKGLENTLGIASSATYADSQ
jgi:hypothetical protein